MFSGAIDGVGFLLSRAAGQEVKNIHLPESIYATDQNEFQSKIMIPLEKICKNCPKPLDSPLQIRGGITDFFQSVSLPTRTSTYWKKSAKISKLRYQIMVRQHHLMVVLRFANHRSVPHNNMYIFH